MRLSEDEITGIIQTLTPFIGAKKAEIRLFGSRIDDKLKGGDIDLLMICEDIKLAEDLSIKKHKILAKLKESIGDQKIDLKIIERTEISNDAFLQIIFSSSILLHIFP